MRVAERRGQGAAAVASGCSMPERLPLVPTCCPAAVRPEVRPASWRTSAAAPAHPRRALHRRPAGGHALHLGLMGAPVTLRSSFAVCAGQLVALEARRQGGCLPRRVGRRQAGTAAAAAGRRAGATLVTAGAARSPRPHAWLFTAALSELAVEIRHDACCALRKSRRRPAAVHGASCPGSIQTPTSTTTPEQGPAELRRAQPGGATPERPAKLARQASGRVFGLVTASGLWFERR